MVPVYHPKRESRFCSHPHSTWDSVKAGLWTVDWTMDWITGIWTQFQTHFSYGSKPGKGGGTTVHSVNAFPTGGFD